MSCWECSHSFGGSYSYYIYVAPGGWGRGLEKKKNSKAEICHYVKKIPRKVEGWRMCLCNNTVTQKYARWLFQINVLLPHSGAAYKKV